MSSPPVQVFSMQFQLHGRELAKVGVSPNRREHRCRGDAGGYSPDMARLFYSDKE
jgi:hypothetical protein